MPAPTTRVQALVITGADIDNITLPVPDDDGLIIDARGRANARLTANPDGRASLTLTQPTLDQHAMRTLAAALVIASTRA